MSKRFWPILFFIVLVTELMIRLLNNNQAEYFIKPLLLPLLAGYFFSQTKNFPDKRKKWVLLALLFSWIGDILLLFDANASIFFLLGLSSFLGAHIFYIIFFKSIKLREGIKNNLWMLVIVVIYYAALISWLSPYLGEMKLPVRIYGIVISLMFMLALHMLSINNKLAGSLMMSGALFFVISDSTLAINKFYQSFAISGLVIMLTYGLAQFLIVEGGIKYIREQKI